MAKVAAVLSVMVESKDRRFPAFMWHMPRGASGEIRCASSERSDVLGKVLQSCTAGPSRLCSYENLDEL